MATTLLVAVAATCLFGFVASYLMTRASSFSAVTNLLFGAIVVLTIFGLLYLLVIVAERRTFG
jgi:uncharacterized membrane protein